MKFIAFCLSTVAFVGISNAQLELFPAQAQYLATYNFLGSDYVVSNVSFTGDQQSYAGFDAANTNLGLSTGFVLTTGSPFFGTNLAGPNSKPNAGVDMQKPGHSLLTDLIGGIQTYDAAVLEFDFVPQVDSIRINLSFASEEYEEYVGSVFNDPMAVFLSGPGIPGMLNIALLPDSQPIAINNVHNVLTNTFGSFSSANGANYYDNTGTGDPTSIEMDGFTINTSASYSGLQIGATYHLFIGLADAGDGVYDSALFLEACESCNYTLGVSESSVTVLNVYPSPTSDFVTVNFSGNDVGYEVFDQVGNLVAKGIGSQETSIDVQSLGAGIYMLTTENGETARFVKE